MSTIPANQPVVAFELPGGYKVWAGDSLPTLATDSGPYEIGDFFWVTGTSGSVPVLYRNLTRGGTGTGFTSATAVAPAWQLFAGQQSAIKTVTAAYSAANSDETIIMNAGAAVTLPVPAANLVGKTYTVKAGASGAGATVVVSGTGAIDGGHTVTLANAYCSVTLKCDGTQWWVISAYPVTTVGSVAVT